MDALVRPSHTPPIVGFGPTEPVGLRRRDVVLTSTGQGDWPADNSGVNLQGQ